MRPVLLPKIGKARRAETLQVLKRVGRGLTVQEIARELGLTPTGVKPICLALEKAGYLTSWRRPMPRGRPSLEYRLTRRAEELFPLLQAAPLLSILRASARLFGPTAPGKLLLQYFQELTTEGERRVRGDTPGERLEWVARWRDQAGYFASVDPGPPPCLIERHHPLAEVAEAFPEIRRMEEQMLSRLLGCPVRVEEKALDGSSFRRFIAAR